MNNISRFTTIGIPAAMGLCLAWVGNRIIKNENELRNRELELTVQLDTRSFKNFQ